MCDHERKTTKLHGQAVFALAAALTAVAILASRSPAPPPDAPAAAEAAR